MSRFRLKVRFIFLSLLILLSVVTVVFVQLPGSSLLWRELQNTGHTVLFAIMTLALMEMLRRLLPVVQDKWLTVYKITAAVLVMVAVLTEIGQLLTHREPSLTDIVRDMAGILIGLGLYASIDPCLMALWKRYCGALRAGTVIVSLCMLLVSLLPLLHLTYVYLQRNEAFPVIIDFQAGWIESFLQLNQAVLTQVAAPELIASDTERLHQQRISELKLKSGNYPGVSIIEPYPDWSAYTMLILNLYSPQVHSFSLVLRIHDSQHNQEYSDRFNQVLTIMPGNNRFSIPLYSIQKAPKGRDMDMSRITNVMLFAINLEDSITLYPGVLSLE